MEKERLSARKEIEVRFSEVDSMGVVWHGSYPLYFEDAREEFGRKYGLGYLYMKGEGYYVSLVELTFKYKRPIVYGMRPVVEIFYVPTESAKIVFEYEVRDEETGRLLCCGRSVQVFMDMGYEMSLCNPSFYEEWKRKWIKEEEE